MLFKGINIFKTKRKTSQKKKKKAANQPVGAKMQGCPESYFLWDNLHVIFRTLAWPCILFCPGSAGRPVKLDFFFGF